ncbi:MAG: DUF167 domain-containing protein [Halothiobacillus sp.]
MKPALQVSVELAELTVRPAGAFFLWQDALLIVWLKVQPRASRNAWGEVLGDRIKLYLTTPPVDGKANEAVIAFIAKEFGVAKNQVRICRGETGRDKEIHIQSPQNCRILPIE